MAAPLDERLGYNLTELAPAQAARCWVGAAKSPGAHDGDVSVERSRSWMDASPEDGRHPLDEYSRSTPTLAAVTEARNRSLSSLIMLLGHSGGGGGPCHAHFFSFFSVVELWRLREVCRAFRGWTVEQLASMPRVVAVGGSVLEVMNPNQAELQQSDPVWKVTATAGVEMLDFSTLRWARRAGRNGMPPLPEPRAFQDATCSWSDGTVIVGGGWNVGRGAPIAQMLRSVLQWTPGAPRWTKLPEFTTEKRGAASVSLPDGGLMVLGGWGADDGRAGVQTIDRWAGGGDQTRDQVPEAPQIEVLPPPPERASGAERRWIAHTPAAIALPPEPEPEPPHKIRERKRKGEPEAEPEPAPHGGNLPKKPERRRFPTAVLLRSGKHEGKVLIAGGKTGASSESVTDTCDLWDPGFEIWTELPPMSEPRSQAAGCLLPSGHVAIVGGLDADNSPRSDGEIFNPETEEWRPMPAAMHPRGACDVTAVPGGLLVVGCSGGSSPFVPCELYDEESDRWFLLPHHMVEPRVAAKAVVVPVAALMQRQRKQRDKDPAAALYGAPF